MAEERQRTDDLRREQEDREAQERDAERAPVSGKDAKAHGRRADKAAYLREKLEERAQAEREND